MDKLKIWFADFWPEWKDEDFISPILKNHFEVVLDKEHPDVLFHSIFNKMVEAPKYKCKKVLILAENWRPSQFQTNYSISFDPHSTTNYRLPLWQVYILLKPELRERLYNRLNRKEEQFEQWCAFTVSNPSNFMRNSAFQQLSQYKSIKSYGRCLTNDFALQKASEGRYWRDAKDEFFLKRPHKFMMAYENTPYRYYCTEKLMDAFLAGAMPIYCGDPRVGEDWNKGAFIDVTRGRFPDVVQKMDQNPERFKAFYEEPVFTDEQKHSLEWNLSNFEEWLVEIVKK
jgi:hypothetical protein